MSKKPEKDASNLFESLAKQRQKPINQPAEQSVKQLSSESTKRSRRAKGKRSDPNYTQVGAYIPKDLDKAVKRRLIDEEIDFSDLVSHLLQDWLNQ